jgi:hypothetical protein
MIWDLKLVRNLGSQTRKERRDSYAKVKFSTGLVLFGFKLDEKLNFQIDIFDWLLPVSVFFVHFSVRAVGELSCQPAERCVHSPVRFRVCKPIDFN